MNIALAVTLLFSPIAQTPVAPTPKGSVYRLDAATDLVATFSTTMVTVLIDLEKSGWTPAAACTVGDESGVCDRQLLSIIDRWSVDSIAPELAQWSDALLVSMLGGTIIATGGEALFGKFDRPGLRFVEDSVVVAESVAFTSLMTSVLKVAVRRPRPLSYNPKVNKEERFLWDVRLSFPSGHTAVSFAAATALTMTLFERRSGVFAIGLSAAAYGVAGLVGYFRLASGRHFLTDVLAGAALGIVVGIGVAVYHRRPSNDDATTAIPARPATSATNEHQLLTLGGTF